MEKIKYFGEPTSEKEMAGKINEIVRAINDLIQAPMFEREIKVTECGSLQECELNDRISIEFSPYELTNLIYLFRTRREGVKDYPVRDNERILLEAFETAREMWEKARREADK